MTDLDMRQNVEAELRCEQELRTSASVGVSVKDGIVTLTGTVETYSEKLPADRAAARISGVKAIVNELEVGGWGTNENTDEDIAYAAANALETASVPHNQVKVTVDRGWITLKGIVDRQHTRAAAENAVKGIR